MSAPDRFLVRIPFAGRREEFDWLTDIVLRAAAANPDNVFGAVLGLLAGCRPAPRPTASEGRGPTYNQLRAVAEAVGMGPVQGEEWVLLAESVVLSERHVLCILRALAKEAA